MQAMRVAQGGQPMSAQRRADSPRARSAGRAAHLVDWRKVIDNVHGTRDHRKDRFR